MIHVPDRGRIGHLQQKTHQEIAPQQPDEILKSSLQDRQSTSPRAFVPCQELVSAA